MRQSDGLRTSFEDNVRCSVAVLRDNAGEMLSNSSFKQRRLVALISMLLKTWQSNAPPTSEGPLSYADVRRPLRHILRAGSEQSRRLAQVDNDILLHSPHQICMSARNIKHCYVQQLEETAQPLRCSGTRTRACNNLGAVEQIVGRQPTAWDGW